MNGLYEELKQRNVFRVGIAYLALAWLVIQITSIAVPALNLPEALNSIVFYLGLIGFPFALLLAWAFELTPDGLKRSADVANDMNSRSDTNGKLNYVVIGLMILIIAITLWQGQLTLPSEIAGSKVTDSSFKQVDNSSTKTIPSPLETANEISPATWAPSIAVLPFKREGEDAPQMADALTEQIITDLTGPRLASTRRRFPLMAGGIKVLASRLTQGYADESVTPMSIGIALDVKYLLSGVVNMNGDSSRIILRLIRAEDGEQIWSKTYTQQSHDLFQIASIISLNAGFYIIERMPNDAWYRSLKNVFSSHDAHQSFVLAHQSTMRRTAGESVDQRSIVANYEKALEGAPSHYFTNLFLAKNYLQMFDQSLRLDAPNDRLNALISTLEKDVRSTINWQKSNVKELRAIQYRLQQNYQMSYTLAKEVIAINPNSIGGHAMLAYFHLYAGSLDGALQKFKRAIEVGGSLPYIYIPLARILAANGQAEAGISVLDSNLSLMPANYSKCLMMVAQASIMLLADQNSEAESLADKASVMCMLEHPSIFMNLLVELGKPDQAIKILKREEKSIDPDAILILETYFLLGDIEQVLVWIERGKGNIFVNRWVRFKRNFGRKEGPNSSTLTQLLNHPDFVSAESQLPALVL